MGDYKYHLERYHGVGSRHECPKCHDKHSFAYYVDDNGNILDKSVGRCNHESGCGYHYTPKQWFRDNPTFHVGTTQRFNRYHSVSTAKVIPIDTSEPKPDFINPWYVSASSSFDSSLVYFLCGVLRPETIKRVWSDYGIGATKQGDVIYWQIDINFKVRTGKIMKYDPANGHRIKNGSGVNWVHSILKKRGLLPDTFHLVQCLFGEHLLKWNPDKEVALVESEKTALIGASVFPQYVWLATGGKSQLNPDKMKVLRGRRVVAFPDVDGFKEWKEKAKELAQWGILMNVSDVLERNATPDERSRKIDIADWILQQLSETSETELILARMIERNTAVGMLIDKLKLEVV